MEEHAGRYGAGFISQANSAQANAGYRSSKLSGNAGNISDSSGMRDTALEKEEETRFYAKLASRAQNHTNYFANKRKEQLLMDAGKMLDLIRVRLQPCVPSYFSSSPGDL